MAKMHKNFLGFSRNMFIHCILLFAGICGGLWINKYILVFVMLFTIMSAFLCKTSVTYYHLLFCLPFAMIYKLSPTSTSLFTYSMLIAGVLLIFKLKRLDEKQIFLIIIFGLYVFIGMGTNYTTVIKMVMGLLLFYIFVKQIKPSDYKNQIMAFTLGMLGSSAIGLLKGNWERLDMYYSDMNPIYIGTVRSIRFSGLYLDPNYYSISAIFALTLCLMLLFRKEGNRLLLIVSIAALSVFGFISYSKMFLLAFAIVVLMFFFNRIKSSKGKTGIVAAFIIGGGLLYNWMSTHQYIAVMMRRLIGKDISTGRFSIWKTYLKYIGNSPGTLFFGDGLGAPYYNGGGPHNTFIESVYFLGLLGSIILIIVLVSIFLCNKKHFPRSTANFVLLTVFLIMIFTLGCLTVNDLMFYFMLMYISLNTVMVKGAYINDARGI